jgi:hypothetical protein
MIRRALIAFLLCLLSISNGHAAEDNTLSGRIRDVEVAKKFNEITALSISPLLIGGAINGYEYWTTSPAERPRLPWTAQPWFWGTLLAIGFLFTFNGTIGGLITPIKKSMDAVEMLESKITPFYAAPMVIPLGIEMIQNLEHAGISLSPISNATAAGIIATTASPDPLTMILGTFVGLTILSVLWLSNQAIHTIVLLCPISAIGALLRVVQLLFLGFFLAVAKLSPFLGACIAVMLIIISAYLAGWSFRLGLFGTVFAWDLLWFRKNHPADAAVLAFSASGLPLPVRTMGRLHRRDGKIELVYRPWLIRPARRIEIPEHGRILTHGLVYLQIHRIAIRGETPLIILPPRYRGSETDLARFTRCGICKPSMLKGGLKATLAWLRSICTNSTKI